MPPGRQWQLRYLLLLHHVTSCYIMLHQPGVESTEFWKPRAVSILSNSRGLSLGSRDFQRETL